MEDKKLTVYHQGKSVTVTGQDYVRLAKEYIADHGGDEKSVDTDEFMEWIIAKVEDG